MFESTWWRNDRKHRGHDEYIYVYGDNRLSPPKGLTLASGLTASVEQAEKRDVVVVVRLSTERESDAMGQNSGKAVLSPKPQTNMFLVLQATFVCASQWDCGMLGVLPVSVRIRSSANLSGRHKRAHDGTGQAPRCITCSITAACSWLTSEKKAPIWHVSRTTTGMECPLQDD